MNQKIQIGNRKVGNNHKCFIIAEAGVNHNGDINLAKELIYKAKEANVDCVKFQTFKAERLVLDSAPKAQYQLKTTDKNESQFRMLKNLELPLDSYKELLDLCKQLDLVFMSTPYNYEDVDMLDKLGVEAFKLASISIVEPSFIEYVASKNKPVIMSTGMANLKEVESGIKAALRVKNKDLILLQCTTNYPTELKDVNLRSMNTMRDKFNVLVGYSDHTQSDLASLSAVAAGSCVVEKHFTLDKSMPGPDQSSSYNTEEFTKLVESIRLVEELMGSAVKQPSNVELENIDGMRRSVVAKVNINKGQLINESMLTLKRPGFGLSPNYLKDLIGTEAKKAYPKNTLFSIDDL